MTWVGRVGLHIGSRPTEIKGLLLPCLLPCLLPSDATWASLSVVVRREQLRKLGDLRSRMGILRVSRKLCDRRWGGWRAGRILDKGKPQRGWTGQDVDLIIQEEVKMKAILKKKKKKTEMCSNISDISDFWCIQGKSLTPVVTQGAVWGMRKTKNPGSERTRCAHSAEMNGRRPPFTVERMFFQSVSVYKRLRFSVAPQHYLWEFRDFEFQIEKPYTFPGHLQHFQTCIYHSDNWQCGEGFMQVCTLLLGN